MSNVDLLEEDYPLRRLIIIHYTDDDQIACQIFDTNPKIVMRSPTELYLSTVKTERLLLIDKDNEYKYPS